MKPEEQRLLVQGWVRSRRDSKEVSFVVLNDGSTISTLQIVLDESFRASWESKNSGGEFHRFLAGINTGACISVAGRLVPSSGAGQVSEINPENIIVYGPFREDYPLQKKGISMETLRELSHLRVRTNTFSAVFRIRHALSFAIHQFFHEKGFYYVHTPVITASDTEGAGEMFAVTTLDFDKLPRNEEGGVDFTKDFFGRPAKLTVSGQLNGELLALGLGEIYTFGPTFRAENSNTSRHLSEFWMIEPEMAFCDLNDNQDLAEEFLKAIVTFVMGECASDLDFLDKWVSKGVMEKLRFVQKNKFVRTTYTEAIEILKNSGQKFEFPVQWGSDLQSEHERFLVEQHFKKPVILTDYPLQIKAFYMKQNEDGKTVRAMDVLFPGIGEIIGGSQREEDGDKLLSRIRELKMPEENYWWYLDTRKYGTAPHSGFGLGFERMMMFITGISNIRDVIPFPRAPKQAEF